MLRVGLTGGIACGKTTVARRLAAAGLPTLDLDHLAHELMAPGQAAHREVVAVFGEGVLGPGGSIDRSRLGAIVFGDPLARERLNGIVHPKVREAEVAYAASLQEKGASVLVTEAALLVESGVHLRFDRLVVVACASEEQLARLRHRGLDEAAARSRVKAQMPLETKRRFAHFVLETVGTLDEAGEAADALGRRLAQLAAERPRTLVLDRSRAWGGLRFGEAIGPRGLSAAALAEHLLRHDGLDLAALARLTAPESGVPWYRAGEANGGGAGPGAAALLVPLVLFELARHGLDEGRLAAAAHSLSWLLERGSARRADAVCFALALAEVVAGQEVAPGFEKRVGERFERSGRPFADADPSPALRGALRCAREHPGDVEAARQAAAGLGAPPGLAGALVGLAVGAEGSGEGPFRAFLEVVAPSSRG